MNAYEMVLGIVIVAILGGVLKSWMRGRGPVASTPPIDAAQEQRLAKLEERVQALEAVVTDHGYDLRKQFKDLES
jgi:hypothetical protein